MSQRHKSISRLTEQRLRGLMRVFEQDPAALDMGVWGYRYHKRQTHRLEAQSKPTSDCGAVACLAGWACFLYLEPKQLRQMLVPAGLTFGLPNDRDVRMLRQGPNNIAFIASELLGLPPIGISSHPLFYIHSWPDPYREDYLDATTRAKEAKVTRKRILHLIRTGK